jgi:hypothetical protein
VLPSRYIAPDKTRCSCSHQVRARSADWVRRVQGCNQILSVHHDWHFAAKSFADLRPQTTYGPPLSFRPSAISMSIFHSCAARQKRMCQAMQREIAIAIARSWTNGAAHTGTPALVLAIRCSISALMYWQRPAIMHRAALPLEISSSNHRVRVVRGMFKVSPILQMTSRIQQVDW